MLSPADAALVARETALPGLALLLDPDALGQAINTALPDVRLAPVLKHYLRYKPGMNCLAAYRGLRDGQPLAFYAKAHGADVDVKLAKAEERASVAVGGLPGRLVLAEHGLVLNFFPNDSKLKALRRLGDAEKRRDLLARLFPAQPALWSGSLETLAYKPERRYVCRLTSADGGSRVLRFHTPAGYAAIAALPAPHSQPGGPRLAARLAEDPERGIIAHEWLDGRLLRGDYCAPEWDPDSVWRCGRALAHLHAQPGDGLPRRTIENDLGAIDASRRGLGMLTPHLSPLADRLAARLAAAIGQRSPALASLHGDFYAKQVLDTPTGIAFLDLDEMALGHPAADLGLFIAHLELEAGYGLLTRERAEAVSEALRLGYAFGAGQVSRADLAAHTALGIFLLAHHPFRSGASDWPKRIEALLDACARHLEALATTSTAASAGTLPVDNAGVLDPAMPGLTAALDLGQAGATLAECLRQADNGLAAYTLTACRLLRHKPGRRALIEYTWTDASGHAHRLLGKMRAKGLDRRTFEAMHDLRARGFGKVGDDHAAETSENNTVSLPAPVALVPEFAMWLQERVQGQPAWSALLGRDGIYWGRRIATAIHRLHGSGYQTGRVHHLNDELAILGARLDDASDLLPHLQPRIASVHDACLRLAGNLTPTTPTCIHRDFYPDQVLVDGNRLHLLDFDLLCMGDPAIDIGNFIAHLIEHGLRAHHDSAAYAPAYTAFASHYVSLSANLGGNPGTHLSNNARMAESIRIHTVLSLARHIQISTRFTERAAYTERILAACEAMLADQRETDRLTLASVPT